MTYEEAKEILDKMGLSTGLPLDEQAEALNLAKTVLEKADKYRWHDLTKDPTDLPSKDSFFRSLLCADKQGNYLTDCYLYWNEEYGCYSTKSGGAWIVEVAAWKYIEPFEEERK